VIRKVTVFLSILTAGVGMWTWSLGHSQVALCSSYASQVNGTVAGVECARASSSFMIGVALTAGSVVVLVLVLFAMVKQHRLKQWGDALPRIPTATRHVVGSAVG